MRSTRHRLIHCDRLAWARQYPVNASRLCGEADGRREAISDLRRYGGDPSLIPDGHLAAHALRTARQRSDPHPFAWAMGFERSYRSTVAQYRATKAAADHSNGFVRRR